MEDTVPPLKELWSKWILLFRALPNTGERWAAPTGARAAVCEPARSANTVSFTSQAAEKETKSSDSHAAID